MEQHLSLAKEVEYEAKFSPEMKLMAMILEKAVEDYTSRPVSHTKAWWDRATEKQKETYWLKEKARRNRKVEARTWLFDECNPRYLFSFHTICEYLEVNVEWKRDNIRRIARDRNSR